jgi:hypothetical protein
MNRDKFLAHMQGLKHDEWSGYALIKYDPTEPETAYNLMQFVMGEKWWEEFEEYAWMNRTPEADSGSPHYLKWLFSDASRFADLVAEFRGWTPSIKLDKYRHG